MTVFQMGEQRFREVASFPWGCPARSQHACPGAWSAPAHSGRPECSLTGLTMTCLRSWRSREHRGFHCKALTRGPTTCHRQGHHPHRGSTVLVSFPDARPMPPRRGLGTVPGESALCFRKAPDALRSAQLWPLPPQRAVGSPFTQSRAGNNPRRRCPPAKAKVHARSWAFHWGSEALETRSRGRGDALERRRGWEQHPCALNAKPSHRAYNVGTRVDEGKAGSAIASPATRVLDSALPGGYSGGNGLAPGNAPGTQQGK